MSPEVKYMAKDLYVLPSKALPCEPVDGTDSRYINLSRHLISNPLKNILNISLYNDTFYSSTLSTLPLKVDYSTKALVLHENSGIYDYPSMKVLHSDTGTSPTTSSSILSPSDTVTCFTPSELHGHIQSYGWLFFIQYVPDNAIRSRWYLVQVLPVTEPSHDDSSLNTGVYRISFLAHHPADQFLPDDLVRW